MPNDVYLVLSALYEAYGRNWIPFSAVVGTPRASEEVLLWLTKREYIYASGSGGQHIVITGTGVSALAEESLRRKDQLEQESREQARKEADRVDERSYADKQTKKHFRHNWRIAIFNAVCGFIAGAASEYFLNVIGNAVGLWRSFLEQLHNFLSSF